MEAHLFLICPTLFSLSSWNIYLLAARMGLTKHSQYLLCCNSRAVNTILRSNAMTAKFKPPQFAIKASNASPARKQEVAPHLHRGRRGGGGWKEHEAAEGAN